MHKPLFAAIVIAIALPVSAFAADSYTVDPITLFRISASATWAFRRCKAALTRPAARSRWIALQKPARSTSASQPTRSAPGT